MALTTLVALLALAPQQDSRFTKDLLPVGSTAPTVNVESTKGRLETKSNTPSVLAFWHLGTRDTSSFLTELESLQSQHGRKLNVLSLNVGDPKDRITDYQKANNIDLNSGLAESLKDTFGIKGYPTVYVLDKDNKIVFRDHKPDTAALNKAVESVIN